MTTIELADGIETRLTNGGTSSLADNRQLIFGQLMALAQPLLKNYLSDIYHDAIWVSEHVTGDRFEFWYGVDDSGTAIGTDSVLVRYRNHAWRIVCELRPNRWNDLDVYMTVSAIVRPDGWRK